MKNNNNAIEIIGLSKQFKRIFDKPNTLKERLVFWNKSKVELIDILQDIDIEIKKGETVALIGTNGSGKSTLLKLMTKILYPNKGQLETNGKLTSLLELGAGFHPDFSGRENIYFNASIFGLTRKEIEAREQQIIEFSELGSFIDNPVRTYSSGMYMRLAFSIAINVDADILLIDEILAVGDQHFQEKCFKRLEELKNSDKTIVIVSHSLDVVKSLCNRAIWIYKGNLKLDGDPYYVIEKYLQQLAIDHKKEREKLIQEGKDKYKGTLFVETPKDFQTVKKGTILDIGGWSLCDDDMYTLEVSVNGEMIADVDRYTRQDVIDVYIDQYGGLVDVDTIGWRFRYDTTNLEVGNIIVQIRQIGKNKEEITSKEISFNIEI